MASKIQINTAALQLMAPEQYPVEDAVLYSILSGNNINNEISNIILTGMAMKIEPMRRYAKDYYTLGLPQGSIATYFTAPKEDIEDAIADAMSLSNGVVADLYITNPLTIYYLLLDFFSSK